MTSLLQSNQPIKDGKVGILAYQIIPEGNAGSSGRAASLTPPCSQCGKPHPKLWRFYRTPAGQWGAWTLFRINGQKMAPDLSTPMRLTVIPRDAIAVDSEKEWHRE